MLMFMCGNLDCPGHLMLGVNNGETFWGGIPVLETGVLILLP